MFPTTTDPKAAARRRLRSVTLTASLLAALAASSCGRPAARLEESDTIAIDQLAQQLADSTAARPVLLHVGFAPLFRSGHIPGSRYVGPGNRPDGLARLEKALATIPADAPVVLYCGCCPWQDCPNVRPAFAAAKASGHTHVRVLHVAGNLERDWIDRGLPSEKGGDTGGVEE